MPLGEKEITDALIKSATGEYDLEMVRRLTISSMKISRISGLDGCFRLIELSLSHNQIVEIEARRWQHARPRASSRAALARACPRVGATARH